MPFPIPVIAAVSNQMARGAVVPSFNMTLSPTAAGVWTIGRLNCKTGTTITVDWGDGTSDTYSPGTGGRTHTYAAAGSYAARVFPRDNITEMTLQTPSHRYFVTIDAANPLPADLTYLSIINQNNITWNATTTRLPSTLTYLELNSISNLTWNINTTGLPSGIAGSMVLDYMPATVVWEINGTVPLPSGVTVFRTLYSANITCAAWTQNAIQSIRWEGNVAQAKLDGIIDKIWQNKANFTYATPTLDILGSGNAAPSGTYQAASPPTTGKEKIYDLVNGNYTPAGPEWTVQYQA